MPLAPPTSIPAIFVFESLFATSNEMPAPDSFTTTGVLRFSAKFCIAEKQPFAFDSPSA